MNKRMFYRYVILIMLLFSVGNATLHAQSDFFLKGSANSLGGGCYQITPDAGNQAGMATDLYSINLATTFSLSFTMNFGTKDANGADGMTFIIGTDCNPSLGTGAGLGVSTTSNPSIIAEFDTYQNTGIGVDDIADDHIGLYKNGVVSATANQLNGAPVPAAGAGVNIEDGTYHTIVINWTYNSATSQTISVSFDGVVRKTATGNYLAALFGGTNLNYWSITGSTGGSSNNQSFCYTTPNTKTVCAGGLIKYGAPIKGTNYSWASTPVTNPINGQGTDSIQVNPLVSTVYTCNFVDACGTNRSVQFNAVVNPLPTATLSGSNVCLGGVSPTVVFTGGSATAPYTFTYKVNGGTNQTITSSAATNTVSIAIPTTTVTSYTYTLVSVQESSSSACSQSITTSSVTVVSIYPLPMATIGQSTTICQNGTAPDITFTGSAGTAPYNFTYNVNGGTAQTITTTSGNTVTVAVSTAIASSFTYSLISVKDANSCTQTQTGNAVVTVNPSPTGTISGAATVCLGATAPNITFTGLTGNAPYTFIYSLNGTTNTVTAVGTTTTLTVPTNVATVFNYSLMSVADNLCSQTQSGSAVVALNALPTAAISSNVTVCQNSTSPNIVFTGTSATAPYLFTYSINGVGSQTVSSIAGTTASVSVPTGTVTTYTYNLISVQEGSSASCIQNQTGSASVEVRAPSQGTVTAAVHRICQNSASPSMMFNGSVGTPPYTFYYTIKSDVNGTTTNSVTSTGSTATVQVSTANADTLVYTITNIQDASGIICGIGGSFDTTVIDPLPKSTITAALNDVCLGDPAQTITFTSIGVPAPVTFNYYTSVNGGANVAQTPISSTAPSLTTTLSVPATTLGTTIYTNGISSSNVCTGSGNGSARLTVNPIPTASLSLTGSSTICQSGGASQVTFTGSIGHPPFVFNYNIDGAGTTTITTLSGKNSVVLPLTTLTAGTHTVNLLSVKDTFNCSQPQTGSVTVTVDPLPTASSGGLGSICMNGTATVSGASAANGSINWSSNGTGAGTITNATGLTPSYAAAASDAGKTVTLTMTVTSTNTCNPNTATAQYTVNVDSLPLATAGGIKTICENASVTISGAIAKYGSILWTGNGLGTISNATTLTPSYAAVAGDAGNTVILTMTVSSTNSCAPQSSTATYTIQVDHLPTATITGSSTICENSTATVSTASQSYGTPSWTWNEAGSITAGVNTLTPTYTAAAGDAGKAVTLTMTVTSTNTCASQTASANYIVNVDHLPIATITGSTTICENSTTTISTASQSYGTPSWTENGAGSITSGVNTLTPTYTAAHGDAGNAVILTMTVTSTNTCASQTATASYTVNVDKLPTATSGGTHTICQNASYTLTNGEASMSNATVQSWSANGTGSITNGNTTLMPTYTANSNDAGKAVTLTMTVSSNNTCSGAIATATYTINVDKLPTATSGGIHTICQNASYTLSNGEASMSDATVQSWSTNGAGSITGGNTTLMPTYKAAAGDAGNAVILTMTVSSNNTCSGAIATATYTINVDELPTANATGPHTICQNASYTLQNGEASMSNATVQSWSATGAGSITSGNTTLMPTYTANSTDAGKAVTLTMTVTSNNTCSGATATASYTINVDPLPTAGTAGSATICENASYTLKNGEAIQSYGSPSWTANGAGSITNGGNPLQPTYTANSHDAGKTVTLTMKVTSTNTCSNATATANYIINVDYLPTATAGTPQTICQGNTATISGTQSGYGTINWTTNGQGTLTNSGTLSPQYTSTPADAGNTVSLTMTVTSNNSCALPIPAATTSVITSISVRPALTATVTAPQRVCQNSTAQVVFTITSQGTAPYTFNYTENGVTKTVSTINGNNVAVVGVSTSNAVPVVYNLSHIQDANCQQTVAASATMTVLPLPDATISQNEDVCRDSMPKAILFKGLNGAKPYTFTFTINNDSVTQSADSVYSTNPATDKTGTFVYTLTNVTDGNNCSKTLNQTATVVVHENPHAIFIINPERTSILEPTITITDASIATTSWYWDFGDKNLSPSPNPKEHTYADTGTYKMKLIVSNGSCKDSTYEIVRITLPTSLYVPNTFSPNGDGVNDVFKAEGDGITTFEMMIYDRWGQLVFQSTDINKGWDGKVNGGTEVAAMDTYVYVINITAFANKHNYTYRGMVNLMK